MLKHPRRRLAGARLGSVDKPGGKAPLAIMIMVSEMTGNYSLLIPSMVSVVIAYFLTGDSYIYENQVDTRADSPAHQIGFRPIPFEKIGLYPDAYRSKESKQ